MPLKCLLVLLIIPGVSGVEIPLLCKHNQPHISIPLEHRVNAAFLAFKAVLNLAFDSLCSFTSKLQFQELLQL